MSVRNASRSTAYTRDVFAVNRLRVAGWAAAIVMAVSPVAAQAPPPPTPTPTPSARPAATPAPTPGAKPSATPAAGAPPAQAGPFDGGGVNPRLAGVPIYAGAAFLESFDLEKGQTVFVFGTNDPYATVVAFYKNKYRAQEVSKTPAIQQFDLGSFDAGTMTQRPSVTVKDFTWPDAAGYLHVSGAKQTRYVTIIQIIPATR